VPQHMNIIGGFFSGEVAPGWPHFWLLTITVIGSAAVAWGIIREAERVWSLTTLLVVGGVSVEAICTLLLFGFDEGISGKQQSTINTQQLKIIALETELAPRTLTPSQQQKIADALKDQAKPNFAFSIFGAPEPAKFMADIASSLELAGWNWVSYPAQTWPRYSAPGKPNVGAILSFSGLQIEVPATHESDWEPAANALRDVLNAQPGIVATEGIVKPGTEAMSDAVVIFVGAKP